MVIKSKNMLHLTILFNYKPLEVIHSYKYFCININHKLNWNLIVGKIIFVRWKTFYGFENKCKSPNLCNEDKKVFLFSYLITPIILDRCEV